MQIIRGPVDPEISAMFDPFQRSPQLREAVRVENLKVVSALKLQWQPVKSFGPAFEWTDDVSKLLWESVKAFNVVLSRMPDRYKHGLDYLPTTGYFNGSERFAVLSEALDKAFVALGGIENKGDQKTRREVASKPAAMWLAIASSALLLIAALTDGLPYGFFTVLRIVVCCASVFALVWAMKENVEWLLWTHGAVAVLFNPIFKVHLGRDAWAFVDALIGGFMFYTAAYVWRRSASRANT